MVTNTIKITVTASYNGILCARECMHADETRRRPRCRQFNVKLDVTEATLTDSGSAIRCTRCVDLFGG